MGRSRDKGGAAIMALALTLMLVGYIGLFFGRWIKAAVSRQREYLADASAVQFTRNPDGIAGALKKIAIHSDTSYLHADTEEVGHMLFGQGRAAHVFATHPPLLERIRRVEPQFSSDRSTWMNWRHGSSGRRCARPGGRLSGKRLPGLSQALSTRAGSSKASASRMPIT